MSANTIPDDVMLRARQIMAASPVEFGGGLEGGAVLRCIIDGILAERDRCAKAAESVGNFGDYKRDELTKDFGQPRYDMMVSIVEAILNPPSAASSPVAQSDWITWNGGECPVGPEARVLYRVAGGSTSGCPDKAAYLRWEHIGSGGDIIAYRIVPNLTHEEAQ